MRTWRVGLDDGLLQVVEAHGFHEDGKFTLFTVPNQPPVFATLTARIVSISREPDDLKALREGLMTINQYRAKLGYPPLADTDEPVAGPHETHAGDTVHFVGGHDGACYDSLVERVEDDGKLFLFVQLPDAPIRIPGVVGDHAEHRRCTWHWSCDGDERPSEPDSPAPTSITVNVQGSVVSERDLLAAIQKQMWRRGMPPDSPRY